MAKWFLPNPGFELGNVGWGSLTDATVLKDAGNARSGAWCGRLIGTGVSRHPRTLPLLGFRPGGRIQASAWIKGGTAGTGFIRIRGVDKDGSDLGSLTPAGNFISSGGGYLQSSMNETFSNTNLKFIQVGVWFSTPTGTWYFDDIEASGDIIESIPATAGLSSYRVIPADTMGRFDPLVGQDKFTEFNSGMSDHWAGVYNFRREDRGGDLNALLAFLRRVGNIERFFAYDPDRKTPVNGVVNGMTVDGAVSQGVTRIPVTGGPVSSTALVAGDYVEVRAQYFQLQRDLEIGPEGTGDMIVWPSVRAALVDGEDVITDNPKMVARITSSLEWMRSAGSLTEPSISWEEV